MNKELSFIVSQEETGQRVDKVASAHGLRRSLFSEAGTSIFLNGKSAKKGEKVREGDTVSVSWEEAVFVGLESENIPLSVIVEDDQMLAIEKPAGMVVHPGAGVTHGTLVNALLYRYGNEFATLSEEDDEDSVLRPGIVHRLDKDTSGVMVVAKTAASHVALAEQFASHTNEKYYLAICKGVFEQKRGMIDARIARSDQDRKLFTTTTLTTKGKDALTQYTVLRQFGSYALLRIRIFTGRTHQIRVHMKSIGHPVLGDPLYSKPDPRFQEGMMLHAFTLDINHPTTHERLHLVSPMPKRFKKVLYALLND